MMRQKPKPNDLAQRIRSLRAEAEAFIDAKTEDLKRDAPGVPREALRLTLTAPFRGDAFNTAQFIIETEGN
jgi:hypothetical protein